MLLPMCHKPTWASVRGGAMWAKAGEGPRRSLGLRTHERGHIMVGESSEGLWQQREKHGDMQGRLPDGWGSWLTGQEPETVS
jgi:hypothetical protein